MSAEMTMRSVRFKYGSMPLLLKTIASGVVDQINTTLAKTAQLVGLMVDSIFQSARTKRARCLSLVT